MNYRQLMNLILIKYNIFFQFYELLIYDFFGIENYKGILRKIIILLFYYFIIEFFNFLYWLKFGQIYYFKKFINLLSINFLQYISFQCFDLKQMIIG